MFCIVHFDCIARNLYVLGMYSILLLAIGSSTPNKERVAIYTLTVSSVVTSFKSSVITCPFMANVTQSEP